MHLIGFAAIVPASTPRESRVPSTAKTPAYPERLQFYELSQKKAYHAG
jgi:hypothetical protein